MKKIMLIFMAIILIAIASAELGTFEKNKDVDLIQTCNNCTYCNITSVKYPNGTNILQNKQMSVDSTGTYFNYNLDGVNTSTVGTYIYCYDCGNAVDSATGCINFEVTLSGINPDASNPLISLGFIGLIFGIACVFLFISSQLQEPGPKIFFLLASFVFIIGSLAISYVVGFDSNLTSGINSTIKIMLFAFGLIFFVMFAYVMIKQIIAALDLYRQNKGYEMGL